jgi:hypothetical protein
VRGTIGPGAELCALIRSSLKPKIRIETARKVMVRNLRKEFIIHSPSEW